MSSVTKHPHYEQVLEALRTRLAGNLKECQLNALDGLRDVKARLEAVAQSSGSSDLLAIVAGLDQLMTALENIDPFDPSVDEQLMRIRQRLFVSLAALEHVSSRGPLSGNDWIVD